MKKLWMVNLVFLLALSNCYSPPSPTKGLTFKLDHFKAYFVDKVEGFEKGTRWVQDQILKKYQWKPEWWQKIASDQLELTQFLVPVSKNKAEKIDPNAHLAWYRFRDPIAIKNVTITYRNQFTDYKPKQITINAMTALLVPTEKIEKGSEFPAKLDHYVCYIVKKSEKPSKFKTVNLSDQFDRKGADIEVDIDPTFFCVPCSKKENKDDKDKGIINGDDHLVVYGLKSGSPLNRNVTINNQFGKKQTFIITTRSYLLVPTKKDRVVPVTEIPQEEKQQ